MAERFPTEDTTLCEEDKYRLKKCVELLVHDVEPDEIVTNMWSKNALSYRQREDIEQEAVRWRKVRMLVDCITRGSQHTYDIFLQALNDDNQGHIAQIILNTPAPTPQKQPPPKIPSLSALADSNEGGTRSKNLANLIPEDQARKRNYHGSLKDFQKKESRHSNRQIQREFGLDVGKAVFFIALLMVPKNVLVHGHDEVKQGFEQQHELYVDMPSLFKHDKKGNYLHRVLILGAAGSGKSTLVQHSCEQWGLGELWTEYRYVFHLTCRHLKSMVENKTQISMLDLLINEGPQESNDKEKIAREELSCNQKDILVVVDGIDELSGWTEFSPGEGPPIRDMNKAAGILDLVHSLMVGRLLGEGSVLFTSRPIDRVDPDLFDKTVRIFGFGRTSIEKCLLALAKGNPDKQKTALEYLDRRPQLYLFCTLPLGCIMTGRVVLDELSLSPEDQEEHEVINCATILYIYVLLVFLNRRGKQTTGIKDRFEGVRVWCETLLKMMKLAAWGMLQTSPSIIFSSETLREHGIDEIDLPCGLLDITTDGKKVTNQPEDTTGSFIHFSLQEFLTALHIAITWKSADIKMITSRKASHKFNMVLLYLSGLLGNQLGRNLIRAIDKNISLKTLSKRLTKLFDTLVVEYEGRFRKLPTITKKRKDNTKLGRLQLLRCSAEGNHKGMIKKIERLVLKAEGTLDLSDMPGGLLPEHMPAVAFFIQWSEAIQSLSLEKSYSFGLMKMITPENQDRLVPLLDTVVLESDHLQLQDLQVTSDDIAGLVIYVLTTQRLQTIEEYTAVKLMRGITSENQDRLVTLLDRSVPGQDGMLNLSRTSLTEEDCRALESYICHSKKIEQLRLENSNIVGMIKTVSPKNQVYLAPLLDPSLISQDGKLDLSGTFLTEEEYRALAAYVSHSKEIKQLILKESNIVGLIKMVNPENQALLVRLLSLSVTGPDGMLDLSNSILQEEDCRVLGVYVPYSQGIKQLILKESNIVGLIKMVTPENLLVRLLSLSVTGRDGMLDLSNSILQEEDCRVLAVYVPYSQRIKQLILERSNIVGMIKTVSPKNQVYLAPLLDPSLISQDGKLDLSGTFLTEEEYRSLAAYVSHSKEIKQLILKESNIVGLIKMVTPENRALFVRLLSLSVTGPDGMLDLSNSTLTEQDCRVLGVYVPYSQRIKQLILKGSNIVGLIKMVNPENQALLVRLLGLSVTGRDGMLDLSNSTLTEEDCRVLGVYVPYSQGIKQLILEKSNIVGLIKTVSPKNQVHLAPLLDPSLISQEGKLDLSGTFLTEEEYRALAAYVSHSKEIKQLILEKSNIVGLIKTVSSENQVCLTPLLDFSVKGQDGKLDLSDTSLTEEEYRALAAYVSHSNEIKQLNLDDNETNDVAVEGLITSLRINTSLKTLVLGPNQITVVGANSLSKAFRENTTLEALDLRRNKITDVGADSLFTEPRVKTTLDTLGWFHGKISRKDSEKQLSLPGNIKFTFLIRDRETAPGKNTFKALHNYKKCGMDDISFHKGDYLEITVEDGDWWLALNVSTMEEGYIPRNYVAAENSLESHDWFHGRISRKDAEKQLMLPGNIKGTFLIRDKETVPESYALSVRDYNVTKGDLVKHYRLRNMDNSQGFFIATQRIFTTLQELIVHYQEVADGLCSELLRPCPKPKPVMIDLSRETRDQWEIPRSSLEFEEQLGAGMLGEVWKGQWSGTTSVAIKTLKEGTTSKEAYLAEAKLIKSLIHNNIVRLYAVCSQEEPMYSVMELMTNGRLLDFLRGPEGRKLQLEDIIDMAAQIANGMAYLEKMKCVHRNLAARNVLVGENNNVKIADFALAVVLENHVYYEEKVKKLPFKWTAPEAAMYGKFTIKSDVWSFGILLVELFTKGLIPYPGMNNREVFEQVERGFRMPRHRDTPGPIYDIMLKCWNAEPEGRLTFEFLHYYLENIYNF